MDITVNIQPEVAVWIGFVVMIGLFCNLLIKKAS